MNAETACTVGVDGVTAYEVITLFYPSNLFKKSTHSPKEHAPTASTRVTRFLVIYRRFIFKLKAMLLKLDLH